MKLTEEENRKALVWYQRYLNDKAKFSELEDILFEGNRYHRDDYEDNGHISFDSPYDIEVDMDELAEILELDEDEQPTEKQIEEHQEARFKEQMECGEGFSFSHYYLYLLVIDDKEFWIRTLHGDGGYRESFSGPFDSAEDCVEGATYLG